MKFSDALSRVPWQDFEVLVANHYRDEGFDVIHCGDGRFGMRGGADVDLRMRKAGALTLVQCRHESVGRIDAASVARLLALRDEDGAVEAILVSSADIPEAARRAAEAGGLTVVDGVAVRRMLGERLTDLHPVRSLPGVDAQHGEAHIVVKGGESRRRGRGGWLRRLQWPAHGGPGKRGKQGKRGKGKRWATGLLALALLGLLVYYAPLLKQLARFGTPAPPAATQPADGANTVEVPLPPPPADAD